MKIKTGDNVIVLTGKDKGKTGKVTKAFPREDKILIEGINMKKRHRKPTREGTSGQIVEFAHPIHVSNARKTDAEVVKAPSKKTASKSKAKA